VPVISQKNVKLVISPCGLGTVQEALFYARPLICIPILGDQVRNHSLLTSQDSLFIVVLCCCHQMDIAARVVDHGAGLYLDKNQFQVNEIQEAILTVLNDRFAKVQFKQSPQ
jgi:UDP:flavonoid glycosyltransferase YjiC (YdhE family)